MGYSTDLSSDEALYIPWVMFDTNILTTSAVVEFDKFRVDFFFFFSSSGGRGKIKLKLTTLPRIFIRVVCRFNSVATHLCELREMITGRPFLRKLS